jgi:hypothetical protein
VTVNETSGTFGIDLAAQSKNTAVCMIEWDHRGHGYVHCPAEGVEDHDLVAQLTRGDYISRIAIDAPFGWPIRFLEAVNAYQETGIWPDEPGMSASQRCMRLRLTDRTVHEDTKITPLSVSTDRIGVVAMRCARLLAKYWAVTGETPDRSGEGHVLEVYPAAALRCWSISPRDSDDPGSYKGRDGSSVVRREGLLDRIATQTSGWLEIPEKSRSVCVDNDDCLDAFISALVARAAAQNLLEPIPSDVMDIAQREGWIRLPTHGSLRALMGR